jgi:hypothetical protein
VLDSGDQVTSVQAVFSWSYQKLTDRAAKMFRLLGLHPPTGITAYAAAGLAALPPDHARDLLRDLARRHLLAEPVPGRYSFHDLVRAYAARQCESLDSEDDRAAALARLFDYFVAATSQAMDALVPAGRRRPAGPAPGTPLPPLGTPEAASAWLDTECPALVAVAGHPAAQSRPRSATRLPAILVRYYRDLAGHHSGALAVHADALRAAAGSGDRAAQADALLKLGMAALPHGGGQRAARQIGQAPDICPHPGVSCGPARAHSDLGVVL